MKSTSAERISAVGRSNSLRISFYCHLDFIKCFTIRRTHFGVQLRARNEACHDSIPRLAINEAIDEHYALSFRSKNNTNNGKRLDGYVCV